MIAKWNGITYNLLEAPVLSKSSREITFPEIKIDFTDSPLENLPIKMQEITIEQNGEVIYYGYCDGFEFPEIDGTKKKIIVSIDLLSPSKMASIRTRTIERNSMPLNEVVADVLVPLIQEGFTIVQNLLPTFDITISEGFKSVEEIMNNLSNSYDFYWYINEKKEIYLIDEKTLQMQKPVLDSLTEIDEFAGYTYKPKMSAVDYANIINAKNQNILEYRKVAEDTTLGSGEELSLIFPVSMSLKTGSRLVNESKRAGVTKPIIPFLYLLGGSGPTEYRVWYDLTDKKIKRSSNVGIDGEDNENASIHVLLKLDPDDKTIITGIKNNVANARLYQNIVSDSAIVKTVTIYSNVIDIEKAKGKVSLSGKVEKTVNFHGKYLTKSDSLDYAKGRVLRTSNQPYTDSVEINIKGTPNERFREFIQEARPLSIIRSEKKYAIGEFIITDTEIVEKPNWLTFTIRARNTNILENYLDIFRKDNEEPEEDELKNQIYSILIKEDAVEESRLTFVDGEIIDENNE